MQADRQHVGTLVEDALRAVAVVVVDVQHRHAVAAADPQRLRRHGRVVDEAVAAHEIGAGMVPGRARQAEHAARALRQQRRGAGSSIGTGLGRQPGAGTERAAVVHRIQPQPRGEVVGLHVAAQAAYRPHRRKGLALGVARVQRQPLRPGRLQEGQIAPRMHLRQQRAAVALRHLDVVAARAQCLQHELGPRRCLEARHALAAEELEGWRVVSVRRRIQNLHGQQRRFERRQKGPLVAERALGNLWRSGRDSNPRPPA